ncbi:unnamed protein product [Caenorhabditis brenneri]
MSLSRPVKFPLLKLPWLCIECVLHNSDKFILIYFATISNRTRRIVKNSKYPLKDIDIHLNGSKQINFGDQKAWRFTRQMYIGSVSLVLQRNSFPLRTRKCFESWIGPYLQSCTTGDTLVALKMGVEFMIDVFGCAIETVFINGNKPLEFLGLGIRTVEKLFINKAEQVETAYQPKKVNIKDLKYLLENVQVTDRCVFNAPIPEDFYCEPHIFKCRRLSFMYENSADWVTLDVLCQFGVPQLNFWCHRFSKQDLVSYVTRWFNSENRKLEYFFVSFNDSISLGDFKIDHLNPMPFCEKRRNRCPFAEGWKNTDISSGKDILRQDGLLATFFVEPTSVFFYIWHKRFPDTV